MQNHVSDDNRYSSEKAREIIKKYFDKNNDYRLVSIVGKWGISKSTVKDKLIKSLSQNEYFLVNYQALQYEENSQVSSQLYKEISKVVPWNYKYKFKACGILKKESYATTFSTDKIFFGIILGLFIYTINLWIKYVNTLLTFKLHNWILALILTIISIIFFVCRNNLVGVISGFMPRKTHIELLKKSQKCFEDKELILFIDEIDRIHPASLKILLDELLIIHEIIPKSRIFLFYDEQPLFDMLKQTGIADPKYYMQKFSDSRSRILWISQSNDLYKELGNWNFEIKTIKVTPFQILPSIEIITYIDNNMRSFRDKDRFIDFVKSYDNSIARLDYQNSTTTDRNLLSDLLILVLFDQFSSKQLFPDNEPITEIQEVLNKIYDHTKKSEMIQLIQRIHQLLNSDKSSNLDEFDYFIFSKQQLDDDFISFLIRNVQRFDNYRVGFPYNNPYDLNATNEDFYLFINKLCLNVTANLEKLISYNQPNYHSISKTEQLYKNSINIIKYILVKLGNAENIIYSTQQMLENRNTIPLLIIGIYHVVYSKASDWYGVKEGLVNPPNLTEDGKKVATNLIQLVKNPENFYLTNPLPQPLFLAECINCVEEIQHGYDKNNLLSLSDIKFDYKKFTKMIVNQPNTALGIYHSIYFPTLNKSQDYTLLKELRHELENLSPNLFREKFGIFLTFPKEQHVSEYLNSIFT